MAGKFELKKAKDGQFYFNLKAANGQIILKSEMYKAKSGADNGIKSVKKNAALDERYDRRESKKGEPYFVLLAANKQVIGQSEMYSSVGAMENGINSVKTNAPDANVDYLTYQVAIACQGGGSHTAFTAGALRTILQKLKQDDFNIVALSGTSGGAICAFLAWYGLLRNDVELADGLLRKFWEKNSTNTPWDAATNSAVMIGQSQMVRADLSPYWFPEYGRYTLQTLLKNLVDVDSISDLIQKNSPKLYVGAVDVRSGSFRVFIDQEVTVDALLASTAIPTIFRAAPVGEDYYWDGLFSQNPPVRDLAKVKPDKLWVIQINPPNRSEVPRTVAEIRDRRNELAGNLSLEQELYFIDRINYFVSNGKFNNGDYKYISVKKVIMDKDYSYVSKLNRSPRFIREIMAYGEKQAEGLFE